MHEVLFPCLMLVLSIVYFAVSKLLPYVYEPALTFDPDVCSVCGGETVARHFRLRTTILILVLFLFSTADLTILVASTTARAFGRGGVLT